jgi:hypothetical protein
MTPPLSEDDCSESGEQAGEISEKSDRALEAQMKLTLAGEISPIRPTPEQLSDPTKTLGLTPSALNFDAHGDIPRIQYVPFSDCEDDEDENDRIVAKYMQHNGMRTLDSYTSDVQAGANDLGFMFSKLPEDCKEYLIDHGLLTVSEPSL